MSAAHLCLTLCDPKDGNPPGSSVHGISQGKDTGVRNHSLLQGIFPTQGSNLSLLHCRQILYHLSHQGSPQSVVFVLKSKVKHTSGEGNGNPLQYSCLENSMDRADWQATVHGATKSWTRVTITEHTKEAQY